MDQRRRWTSFERRGDQSPVRHRGATRRRSASLAERDEHLRLIEQACDVPNRRPRHGVERHRSQGRGRSGPWPSWAIWTRWRKKRPFLTPQDVRTCLDMHTRGEATSIAEIHQDLIQVTARGKRISPRALGQKRLRRHDPPKRHRLWHWASRHGKDVLGHGDGDRGAEELVRSTA